MTLVWRSCVRTLCATAVAFGVLTAEQRTSQRWQLRGVVLTGSQELLDAVVEIEGDRIKTVGSGSGPSAIQIDGVILPGLVDLHNHLTWNVLPRWTPASLYKNRYDWQEDPAYAVNLSGIHYTLTLAGLGCEMNRYAEIKALVSGATSGVGGFATAAENGCIVGLMRNLDLASDLPGSGGVNAERLRYAIFPFELNGATEELIRTVDPASPDGSGKLRAAILHVGEGVDAAARREFRMLRAHGFIRNGVTIVHAIGFTAPQFVELAAAKVGFVWSPRSNLELYGRTADVVAAKAAGMAIAIAPDWSPTGSAGMLSELGTGWKLNVGAYSNAFSDQDFFRMATVNPAALAGLPGTIGGIAPGAMADLLVLRKKAKSNFQPVVRSSPADVLLVMVGGKPLFGDPGLLAQLLPGVQLESVTVCGEAKALNVSGGVADLSFHATSEKLKTALTAVGSTLAPLADCH